MGSITGNLASVSCVYSLSEDRYLAMLTILTMYMTNENVRLFPHDKVFRKIIIPLIPVSVLPNHITILRFFLIPFVLWLLWMHLWVAALGAFLFAAFTDALDGSLARVRKQITEWGTIADPIADKLLIGSVVVLFVAREINPLFSILIVMIELMIVCGALMRRHRGHLVSANEFGKLKMLCQVIGVSLLLIAKIEGLQLAVPFAVGTFSIAIVFAIVSLLTYGI